MKKTKVMGSYNGRRLRGVIGLLVLLLACGPIENEDQRYYAYPQLELRLAPGMVQAELQVTRIQITIEGPDFEPIVKSVDISSDQRRLAMDLMVPVEAEKILIEAYEVDEKGEERVAFSGESPIANMDQPQPKIAVELAPTPTTSILSLELLAAEVTLGQTFEVAVNVAGVSKLFGLSLELGFDEQKVTPTGVELGSSLGNEALLFDDLKLDRSEGGIGIAVGQKGTQGSSATEGTVATVSFRAKAVGRATMGIIPAAESKMLTLIQADGKPIAEFQRLKDYLTVTNSQVSILIK